MPKGVHVHKLSNVNQEALTADCANCGTAIRIRMKAGKPRCHEALKAQKSSEHHKAYMRDYAKKRSQAKPRAVREPRKLRGHGLSQSDAKELREGKACWICGETDVTKLCVDHCHKSNVIRGILCRNHNAALGMFQDNPEHLAKAIEYLNGSPWL